MLTKTMEKALNDQVKMEAESSMVYLAMASWAELQPGWDGITDFFYAQSDEEREHMLKLIRFINERGGHGVVPNLSQPKVNFESVEDLFEHFLKSELKVSSSINDLVSVALEEKDFATHNFLQWYVTEQMEEEKLARTLNDKLALIGGDKGGLYLFDRDIMLMRAEEAADKGGSA
jgi:ferritin